MHFRIHFTIKDAFLKYLFSQDIMRCKMARDLQYACANFKNVKACAYGLKIKHSFIEKDNENVLYEMHKLYR